MGSLEHITRQTTEEKHMPYKAWFQCINETCLAHYPLERVICQCKECGSLLEVRHDMEALRDRSGAVWMKLFDERLGAVNKWPYGSGVWSKMEWVLPNINPDNIVSQAEGRTDLLPTKRLGKFLGVPDLWIKQCGAAPSGSFKAEGMTVLVSWGNHLISLGTPIKAMICSSTGDTSAALSTYCATAGIPCVVVLPKNGVTTAQLLQPISQWATVLSVDTDFDGCMRLSEEIAAKDERFFLANSKNPLRIEGQKTIVMEIIQQLGWEVPDVIIIPSGNLGNVSALGAGLLMMRDLGLISKLPRIVVAQAENANPFVRAYRSGFTNIEPMKAGPTQASAIKIGRPVSMPKAIRVFQQFDGMAEDATEQELGDAAALGDKYAGTFNCPQTGVGLAVLKKLLKSGWIDGSERVIVMSTADGLKFTDFKVAYHEGRLGYTSTYANRPIEARNSVDAIRKALDPILAV